ncbi:MAG: putative methyltransferase (contains TPR repeat) [Saliniramus fredricksonii]|uniref:Predicted methyltransferase, contains TPR repeat n=1 Tax=Saliniramus fredricksonii TaxID=1653334 RepID=A0A0N8KDW7_9HYPH|nr:methyltransferase [Saliniramus fredricksonii]KPQ09690.1 MAG: putative methyltransferase (contains TPR repeat) [Saliniramus fredricksonii]SCC79820.1 Predicted methyltransferase, contains TPR repeat [Saliniramus fredricksonii]
MARLTMSRSTGDLIADRRYGYARSCFDADDHTGAADVARAVLERAPGFAPAWSLLGEAEAALGNREAAIDALLKALEIEPEDVLGASITLARLGALPQAAALTNGYVRTLFDRYAGAFDAHLTGQLEYRAPAQISDALDRLAPGRRFASCLDLGCGTGLMGAAIRERAAYLTGLDIAPAMVAKAAEKRIYDALVVAELTEFLAGQSEDTHDLILAADVMVYIGDPAQVLAGAVRALRPGGLFVFSVQSARETMPEGFRIGADSRFAHDAAFLRRRAADAGFTIMLFEPATTRRDAGAPVPGYLVALEV